MAKRANETNGPTRAAVYCRVSSAGQEDNSSLATQEASCRAYATDRGWTVAAVYREVHTGAELFERPELTRLRETMRGGAFDVLIVHALDRLSRKQTHQGLVLSEAEHAGVAWHSATEAIDDSPQGQILRAVIGGMAEMERLKIAERTQRGIRARASSGKPLPGPRPLFGYRWGDAAKSHLTVDPIAAPVVQRIYADFLGGQTLRSISRTLTLDGIATPTGKLTLWPIPTISAILKNPAYTGRAVAFRYSAERIRGGGTRVTVRSPEDHLVLPDGTIPAIVSAAEHDAALARLALNQAAASRNNTDPESTLLRGGVVRCGSCSSPMSVKHPSANHAHATVYRCSGVNRDRFGCPGVSITAAPLDAAVWSRVTEVLLQPDVIAREVKRRRAVSTIASDLDVIDRRLAAIDRQRQNLVRSLAMVDDEDSARLMTQELSTLSGQHKQLEAERAGRVVQQTDEVAENANLSSLADWCTRAAGNLATLTYSERRTILEVLGVGVRIWKTDHDHRWELTMAPLPVDPDSSIEFRTPCASSTAHRSGGVGHSFTSCPPDLELSR